MFQPWGQICEYPTEQLRSFFDVSKFYMEMNPAYHLPLSAGFLRSAVSVCSSPRHFNVIITALKVAIATEAGS